jgi:hypothetical protein
VNYVGLKGTYRSGAHEDQIEVLSKSAYSYLVRSVDGTVYQLSHHDIEQSFVVGYGHTPRASACTCGAAKVGHPGHAHYCDAMRGYS